jgi:hypothetical protein
VAIVVDKAVICCSKALVVDVFEKVDIELFTLGFVIVNFIAIAVIVVQ